MNKKLKEIYCLDDYLELRWVELSVFSELNKAKIILYAAEQMIKVKELECDGNKELLAKDKRYNEACKKMIETWSNIEWISRFKKQFVENAIPEMIEYEKEQGFSFSHVLIDDFYIYEGGNVIGQNQRQS